MKLGERLSAAAMLAAENRTPGSGRVIDIGSDHGMLPAYLVKNGVYACAVAADINSAPLEKSRVTARLLGVTDKTEFCLSDGFDSVTGFFDTACICGMGGMLIADIIRRGKGRFSRLVLQPMTHAEYLREYLWKNGFCIEREVFVTEARKPYTVMLATETGEAEAYTYAETYIGRERPASDDYRRYVRKVKTSAEKRYGGTHGENDRLLLEECERILKQ